MNTSSQQKIHMSLQKIYNEFNDIYSITKIKKGAASDNYIVTKRNNDKMLIKIPHINSKIVIQTIVLNLSLSHQVNISAPQIIPCHSPNMLCLEYIQGTSISSNKINIYHLEQLWREYQKLKKIPIQKIKSHVNDLTCLLKICKQKINNHNNLSFFKRFLFRKIQNIITEIPIQEISYQKSKLQVIHNDFHNNNILFLKNKLVAILDWEELGIGYACEDWIRFTFCLIERFTNYSKRQKKLI